MAKTLRTWKHAPEPQSLIPCPSNDSAAVGAHGQVENSVGVASQSGDPAHVSSPPDVDLVLGVTVSADDFVDAATEHHVAHLRPNIVGRKSDPSESVSELDGAVCSATSRHKQTVLMGRPGHGLDRSFVVSKLEQRLC